MVLSLFLLLLVACMYALAPRDFDYCPNFSCMHTHTHTQSTDNLDLEQVKDVIRDLGKEFRARIFRPAKKTVSTGESLVSVVVVVVVS